MRETQAWADRHAYQVVPHRAVHQADHSPEAIRGEISAALLVEVARADSLADRVLQKSDQIAPEALLDFHTHKRLDALVL